MVGGNPAGLAAAERRLGLDSTTVVLESSPYGYAADEVVWKGGERGIQRELKLWHLVLRALRDFDVIHFNFGATIAPRRLPRDVPGSERSRRVKDRLYYAYMAFSEQLDLPLLARAGKAIFVTFQGDDARQGDVVARFPASGFHEVAPDRYTPESDENKRRRIARFDRYADGIYALNPDLLRVLPSRARFVPYASVDPRRWDPLPEPAGTRRPLVLHAPTDREIKGTRFLLDAVSRLQAEGVAFDFQLVEGVPQAEARALYHRADLVVDQLLVGWYGALAVEAMSLGKPVIAYLREDDLAFLPAAMRKEIPVVPAEPATIYDVLKELLTVRREELPRLGLRARAYVCRWHDPLRIAEEIVADYEAAVARRRAVAAR
jgi:glycosyltransferase involved in cell wall biosynthesis